MKMGRKRGKIAAQQPFSGIEGEFPCENPVHGYERCILCKKETDVPAELDVDQRCFYIEGAGQLCKACYRMLYL